MTVKKQKESLHVPPQVLKWGLRAWPPFLGAGVWVKEISPDWSYARVELAHNPLVANANRTAFGGSLQSMTDPFFCLLLMGRLGRDYNVWDTSAEIRFVKPGRTRMHAHIVVPDAVVEKVRQETADGSKSLTWFDVDILDAHDEPVAHVRREVYVRRKKGR
ncbi:DUF4442 domain-containing protein [Mariniluteicoccus endophyticus]